MYIVVCYIKLYFSNGRLLYKIILISLTPNIYLMSLVFSEYGRLSLANGIDARHKEELNTTYTALANTYISAIRTISFGVGRGEG